MNGGVTHGQLGGMQLLMSCCQLAPFQMKRHVPAHGPTGSELELLDEESPLLLLDCEELELRELVELEGLELLLSLDDDSLELLDSVELDDGLLDDESDEVLLLLLLLLLDDVGGLSLLECGPLDLLLLESLSLEELDRPLLELSWDWLLLEVLDWLDVEDCDSELALLLLALQTSAGHSHTPR